MLRPLVVVAAAGFVLLASCSSEQELREDCPTAGTACPTCTADTDCLVVSNPCHEHATCTHRQRSPAISLNQIGCSIENDVPPAERCGCVQGVCRAR